MARRSSKHAAEVPVPRRLGVLLSAGVAGLAIAVLGAIFAVSSFGDSTTTAADFVPPSAQTTAPNAPASSPSATPLPTPYVASAERPSRAGRRTKTLAVVRPGPAFKRMSHLQMVAARLAQLQPATLTVGTLNVLGSQHTTGKKDGYGPGTDRAAREAALIEARGLDLVGFQEVQPDQLATLQSHLGGYAVYPAMSVGSQGYRLQIAYRTSRFAVVGTGSTTYLFSHMWIPLPWLLLKDLRTGTEFYVIDTHNSPEGQQADRVTSSNIEVQLIRQLTAATGHPAILMGDLNEDAPVYCRMAAGLPGLTASDGATDDGSCQVPGGTVIDWIMGTKGVTWADDHVDGTPRAQRISDHNLVYATATVQDYPGGVPAGSGQ